MRTGARRGQSNLADAAFLGVATVLATAAMLASSSPTHAADDEDGSSWSDRVSDSMKDTIGRAGHAVGLGKPEAPPTKEAPSGCPTIAMLEGTNAQRVLASGAVGNEGVRYQYSLYHVGRVCDKAGSRVSVKVGGDGRVLLGPAGAAGRFDVPIRVVIYSEIEQKPIESKLYKVPASIGSGQAATRFEFVSDTLAVPIAAGRSASDYSIKVGIDTGGKGAADDKPAKARRHAKAKGAKPDSTESASQ